MLNGRCCTKKNTLCMDGLSVLHMCIKVTRGQVHCYIHDSSSASVKLKNNVDNMLFFPALSWVSQAIACYYNENPSDNDEPMHILSPRQSSLVMI